MAWNTFGTHTAGTALTPAEGDKISNNVKQLANDIYITPASGDDGVADLSYPLEKLAPIKSALTTGNGTTGQVITLPSQIAATSYCVFSTWQADPGSNGAIWVEKTSANFTLKHYGTELGKSIAYQIVRVSA